MEDERIAVLSVSDDAMLLETRERVLRLLGVTVVSCLSSDALQRVRSHAYDLVVLGHSLKFTSAEEIAEEARRLSPKTRVLLLSQTPFHLGACAFADAITEPDPPAVLSEAKALLGLLNSGGGRRDGGHFY